MKKINDNRKLKHIPPDKIKPNPDNPRIIFRQEEMESLMVSIARIGVQVPITVYKDGVSYFLLDGERRWRCAKKLNLKEIPALVQEKPTRLQNLLLMYNIHALREQWDYFTMATNLTKIIDLFVNEHGYTPNEIELSEETGLTRGQIRRCHMLIDLPDQFKDMLLKELELPKSQQKLTEDFFIEMERSLKTVTNRIPKYENEIDEIRNTLVSKFKDGVIGAVTDFRQLSKIATAIKNFGLRQIKAERALNKLFDEDNEIGIKDIYHQTVEFEYDEKKASQYIESLTEYLSDILEEDKKDNLNDSFLSQLRELFKRIKKLLREN